MEHKYILNQKPIDRMDELDVSTLTLEDVYKHYGTGSSISHGSGKDKSYSYRHGIGTNVGDIEENLWYEIVKLLIERNEEQKLFSSLQEWLAGDSPKRSRNEIVKLALELHADRMFDDPAWADFVPFNQKYRPDVLKESSLIDVVFACCDRQYPVTQEQMDNAVSDRLRCPFCGRFSEFCVLGK